MELNKNERYDNLTLEDVNDLCEELDYNCEEIKSLEDTTKALKFLNDKFKDTGKKFDITYQQKYWFLTKEEQEQVGKESYKHYFNTDSIPQDFIYDLMALFDSIRIKKIRKDYPELTKKYEEEYNEDSDNPCVADSKENEFPIDVYLDMFEEEDIDIDIGKKYGYFWEYMTFSENLIESLYNKKVDSLNSVAK